MTKHPMAASLGTACTAVAMLVASSAPAGAQSCPSDYASCDNGGCCLSGEQCCPTLAEGCCSSSTPFCCGDGTCAATPSQCPLAGNPSCDGYDVPCGRGCAPAGSDCCDQAGHYCPPESMCTSDTTCVLGNTPSLAREVAVLPDPEDELASGVSAPFEDPPDATDRSCALAHPTRSWHAWPLLGAALLALRRGPRRAGRAG